MLHLVPYLPLFSILSCLFLLAVLIGLRQLHKSQKMLGNTLSEQAKSADQSLMEKLFAALLKQQQAANESLNQFSRDNAQAQEQNLVRLQSSLRENFAEIDKQVHSILHRSTQQLSEQFDKLNQSTSQHLLKVSETVEVRLMKGFEKTNETFNSITQRLAVIDDAQKKITDLSQNVISLQDILADKRSRGAFGEVQLKALLENVLPPNCYHLQHTLSNGTRVDCLLELPEPTGKIAIDAKFPLENFKRMADNDESESIRSTARQQFKVDIRKHILDISQKYLISGETSDGALMFIPAEAIFAEIHANHPDIVEFAYRSRVFLASPSTMMAILTTASAVLKDSATRKQIHVIQEHLRMLAQDFSRFEKRMEDLTKHLRQANNDADLVHTSAQKITKRFGQIEKVELLEESSEI